MKVIVTMKFLNMFSHYKKKIIISIFLNFISQPKISTVQIEKLHLIYTNSNRNLEESRLRKMLRLSADLLVEISRKVIKIQKMFVKTQKPHIKYTIHTTHTHTKTQKKQTTKKKMLQTNNQFPFSLKTHHFRSDTDFARSITHILPPERKTEHTFRTINEYNNVFMYLGTQSHHRSAAALLQNRQRYNIIVTHSLGKSRSL